MARGPPIPPEKRKHELDVVRKSRSWKRAEKATGRPMETLQRWARDEGIRLGESLPPPPKTQVVSLKLVRAEDAVLMAKLPSDIERLLPMLAGCIENNIGTHLLVSRKIRNLARRLGPRDRALILDLHRATTITLPPLIMAYLTAAARAAEVLAPTKGTEFVVAEPRAV